MAIAINLSASGNCVHRIIMIHFPFGSHENRIVFSMDCDKCRVGCGESMVLLILFCDIFAPYDLLNSFLSVERNK